MKVKRARIEELRSQLAASPDVDKLEKKLLEVAPEFHQALRKQTLIGHREDLGLYVISLDMPYQGLAGLGGPETLVALKKGTNSVARRQTLAHECAHGLLRDVDRPRISTQPRTRGPPLHAVRSPGADAQRSRRCIHSRLWLPRER